jgi:hypothetical protein
MMDRKWAVGGRQWAVKKGCERSGCAPSSRFLIASPKSPAPGPLASSSSLQPTAYCLRRSRRGISLLEVLISMFVMLFGLMGVAVIFPVGNHYAGRGEQFDRGAAMADQAMADLKARGLLKPSLWYYAEVATSGAGSTTEQNRPAGGGDNSQWVVRWPSVNGGNSFNLLPGFSANSAGPGHAFVLDPVGVAAGIRIGANRGLDVFPMTHFGEEPIPGESSQSQIAASTNLANPWAQRNMSAAGHVSKSKSYLEGNRFPIRRLTLAMPSQTPLVANSWTSMPTAVTDTMYRLRDDVTASLPDQDDRPGVMQWRVAPGTDLKATADDIPLARQSTGSYSWLATIIPANGIAEIAGTGGRVIDAALRAMQPSDPRYGTFMYEVSVAVFYKRNEAPSAASERGIEAQLIGPNELELLGTAAAVEAAVVDIRPGNWIALAGQHPSTGLLVMKWYRVLSVDDENDVSQVNGPRNGSPTRRMTLDGPDWPEFYDTSVSPPIGPIYPVENLRAIILPGVIGVSTQTLPLESAY